MIGIWHEEVSVLHSPTNPRIGAIVLAPQTTKSPVAQEIIRYASSNNTGTNRTPRRIRKTGIDGITPVHIGIRKTSTPDPSVISGTSINRTSTPDPSGISGISADPTCGISVTSVALPSGGLWSPRIGNIRQLNTAVDRTFSNDPIVPPVSTQLFGDELSGSSSRNIYIFCRIKIVTESVNPVAPQFVNHGLSTVKASKKSSGI